MKSRAIIPLIVGLAVGGIAIKIFFNVLQKARGSSGDNVEVIRAAADIAPTIEISETMVSKTTVPRSLVPDGTFSDPAKVIGRVSAQMIPKGMPVTTGLLAPEGTPPGMVAKIPDGYRAVAISVDEIVGVGGFIKPGARVDVVMVISGQGKSSNVSRVILQNVEVLAVGQKSDTSGQGAAVTRSVTVLVKPEDASKLHLASTKGKLRLAMRSQDDRREPKPVTLTDEDLLADGYSSRNRNQSVDSVFDRFFGNNSPKLPECRDDVDEEASKNWVVEVRQGAEVYQEAFDSEGKRIVQASSGTRSLNAGKSKSPASDRAGAPSSVQPNHENSTTGAPSAQGQGTGGEEQDMVFEAPTGG